MKKLIIFSIILGVGYLIYYTGSQRVPQENQESSPGSFNPTSNNTSDSVEVSDPSNSGSAGVKKNTLNDIDPGTECKKVIGRENSSIYSFLNSGALDAITKISKAIEASKKDGEDALFFEALHGSNSCLSVLSESEILSKICEVMKDNNLDSYNALKNTTYDSPEEKEKVLGFVSKFLGNTDFHCGTECNEVYNDFLALKTNNKDISNLSEKSSTELSILLMNNSITEEDLGIMAMNTCIDSYQSSRK